MRLRENCWGTDLLCLSSITHHNFSLDEIRIFENYMFEQILKLTKMYLLWKRYGKEGKEERDLLCSPRTT